MKATGFAVSLSLTLPACLAALPAYAVGNSLTMTAGTFDFAGPKFQGGALSGGYGVTPTGMLSGPGFTWEAWVRLPAPPGQPIVAIGSAAAGYLGANAQGQAICNIAAGNTTVTGPALTDGAWHLLDLVGSANGMACFVDGNSVGTSTNVQSVPSSAPFGVGTMGLYPGNNVWSGEIDEASIWNVARYTASFTPPTGPYLGSEAGLVGLWHMNGNGVDYAADSVLSPADPSMLYSPLNWSVSPGVAVTNNAGAYVRTMFTGNVCALNFDTSFVAQPASQIYWRVDGYEAGTPWVRATPAANVPCTPSPDLAAAPWHLLEVAVKSTSETLNRWNTAAPGTAVRLAGITAAPNASFQKPFAAPWQIAVFGDSITEGVREVNSTAPNDTDRNDATLSWAYQLGRYMGAEVGVIGYGATGFTVAGSGGVPPLTTSASLLSNGVARPVAVNAPNLIVVNEGTNDGTANVTAAAVSLLNGLVATYPNTPIALLVPFNQSHLAELQLAAATCARPGLVHLVQTAGLLNPANGVDPLGLHPLGPNSGGIIAPRLASILMPLMTGGVNGLTPDQVARVP